jgi:hypothetical protein
MSMRTLFLARPIRGLMTGFQEADCDASDWSFPNFSFSLFGASYSSTSYCNFFIQSSSLLFID